MASLIKGIPVILYERRQTGTDAFRAPVYEESPVTVDNVLATPVDSSPVTGGGQPDGRRAVYELCIPKTDEHLWEGCAVEFFGRRWQVIGFAQEYIAANLPLEWNRKVRVERYE